MSLPRTIGHYRTTQRIATGGAGEVYVGIDTKVGREVAIKFLRPELASDPSYVDRFLAEAKSSWASQSSQCRDALRTAARGRSCLHDHGARQGPHSRANH